MRRIFLGAVLALTAIAGVGAWAQTDSQALQRMVATERAFAAATAEVGVRDGFLAFFADDAVRVVGSPEASIVPARAGLEAQPLQKLPIANQLIWEPFTGQVSSDGSLGWLTGGYVQLNQAQRDVVAQGAYFSVWKRQANGTWRVWLDEGVNLPNIWQDASPFRVAPEPDTGAAGSASETVEQAEASMAASRDAWLARLGKDVRLHINDRMPIVGREAVTTAPPVEMRYRVLRAEAAGSGDLAVTIGSFERVRGGGPTRGTWVRVWKRDLTAHWRIVFETQK
jgi:hypothetical protein